jgi:hypothetical protein
VNFKLAVVFYKTELPKFVHKKADPRARRADHFRERFLTDLGDNLFGAPFLAEIRQQQERTGQPLLARIKELIYQIFFDPDAARQNM